LLDILKEKNVHATFFVLGSQAAQYPDLVRRMYQEGHEVASHTWSHPHLMSLTTDQIIAELTQTEDLIYSLIGQRPRYIRPPYGETDDRVQAIINALGMKTIMWNMDTVDYSIVNSGQDPKQIVQAFNNVLTSGSTGLNPFNNPGFISLQHDIYLQSVQQESDIISLLASKGLRMVTVSQCTGDGQPYKPPQGSNSVQPGNSQPLPASPVQPRASQPLPATPAVPNGATPTIPVNSSGATPAAGSDSAVAGSNAQRLQDSASQPAGGFLMGANGAQDSASAAQTTGMLWTLALASATCLALW
jgi:peptidoglycan/xylan/chitin deacetylase (PgdA/CDA1 family)